MQLVYEVEGSGEIYTYIGRETRGGLRTCCGRFHKSSHWVARGMDPSRFMGSFSCRKMGTGSGDVHFFDAGSAEPHQGTPGWDWWTRASTILLR